MDLFDCSPLFLFSLGGGEFKTLSFAKEMVAKCLEVLVKKVQRSLL